MKSFRCFLSFLQMIKQHCSSVYFKLQRVKLPIALRLLSALFPRHCPVCAKLVPYGTLIHSECQTVLPFISGPTCLRCGKPVSSSAQEYCYDCRTFPKSFQKGLSLFLYNKETRPIMSAFKYHNNRRLADFFIWELFFQQYSQNYFHIYSKRYSHSHSRIYAAIESLGIDAVIPVPIHKNKYKKRL
jgi:predicted amidophosphoribosyltransferase